MRPREQAKLFALTVLALTIATAGIWIDALRETVRRCRKADEVRRGREEQGR